MTITPEIEAGIYDELNHLLAESLGTIQQFCAKVGASTFPTSILQWEGTGAIQAEFAYTQATLTLRRVTDGECTLMEAIQDARGNLEYSLTENHWRPNSTNAVANAVLAEKSTAASDALSAYRQWSAGASYYGHFEGNPRVEETRRFILN
jgi:hypothetical protein